MECIPAIDIRGGQAVRLVRGDFSTETVFGEPVEMAERFAAAGAPRVHVVDLDAARTGELVNEKLVGQIVEAVRVPIQYGGGVRDLATLDRVVAAGVARVVLGSAAIERPDFALEAATRHPQRVLVGLDHRGVPRSAGEPWRLALHGWSSTHPLRFDAVIRTLEPLPLVGVVVTDITRDGTLAGPDLDGLRSVLAVTALDVYASGGVKSLDDLRALGAIDIDGRRIAGVIVGRAFASGEMSVEEAVAACER
ncbi:MAG: HisA/HisF-related TIM barrel protein [Acidimicrobiales bacterium]